MIARFKEAIRARRHLLRRESLLNGLEFGVGEREFFLVSFPKAGNTWLRLMIAYLIRHGDEIAFHNLGEYIPDSDQKAQLGPVIDRKSEFYGLPVQVIKSHDYFSPFYRGKKVIYIVRNGIDCITSYYHFSNARTNTPIPRDAFIDGKTAKIKSWRRHLLSWHQVPVERLLLVKYEDLKADTVTQMCRVTEFLGIDAQMSRINEVVELTKFDQMRRLEQKYGYYNDNRLHDGRQSRFVRQGKVGARSDVFTDAQIERFNCLSADVARLYGYK